MEAIATVGEMNRLRGKAAQETLKVASTASAAPMTMSRKPFTNGMKQGRVPLAGGDEIFRQTFSLKNEKT